MQSRSGSSGNARVKVDRDVFVIHADDDTPFVKGELLPMIGVGEDRVILASELPFPGFTEQVIEEAIRRSKLVLAVVSPAYLRDRWVGLAELLARNVRDDGCGGNLVPLLIADCDVPPLLAQHAALDWRTSSQREASAARLRARLDQPDPVVEAITCPYPGMQPFSAATAGRFHGRTREIEELLGRLQAGEQLIYVIGPSGSGKSSLVAAGVIARIQSANGQLGGRRVAVRGVRPGEHPTRRLADALGCDPDSLDGAAEDLLIRDGCDRLLVFIDQFEELYALADARERPEFTRAVRVLLADRRCQLIVALRADFYGALMSSELWPEIDGRFTHLPIAPLRGPALREAIEAPARKAGVHLEHALVERLMHDAAAEPGALPLLQEALVLLWAGKSHRLLRLASYDALGSDGRSGLAVALARTADAVLHRFTRPQQHLARRVLLRLVSFGEGRPDTRRQQPRAALASSGERTASVDEVIDRLIDERMLTSDATARGEPLIDLAHEALISDWPDFQLWLRTRRDDEQRRRILELHAAEWVKRGRGRIGLFDPVELGEAERWIKSDAARELGYHDDLPSFLAASRRAIAEAEQQRKVSVDQQAHERRIAERENARLNRRQKRSIRVGGMMAAIFGVLALYQCVGVCSNHDQYRGFAQPGLMPAGQPYGRLMPTGQPYDSLASFLGTQPGSAGAGSGSGVEHRIELLARDALAQGLGGSQPHADGSPRALAMLLKMLGGFARDELDDDVAALGLLRRAHELNPGDVNTLAKLVELCVITNNYDDFMRGVTELGELQIDPDTSVAIAALTWAAAHLTQRPERDPAAQLLRVYRRLALHARIDWSWTSAKRALASGRFRQDDAQSVIDVLAALEKPISDRTRAELTRLLRPATGGN